MNYIKVTTTYPTGGTLLPNAFVDNYMIRANGEYIKVYIYLLRMVSDGANFSIPCLADWRNCKYQGNPHPDCVQVCG